jgi:hypothetical protein
MTRRRLLLLALPVAVALVGVGGWMMWPRPSAITKENIAKVQPGMTLTKVEAIVGGPARDEMDGNSCVLYPPIGMIVGLQRRQWVGPEVAIQIVFGDDGVLAMQCGLTNPVEETLRQRLCRWLRL